MLAPLYLKFVHFASPDAFILLLWDAPKFHLDHWLVSIVGGGQFYCRALGFTSNIEATKRLTLATVCSL